MVDWPGYELLAARHLVAICAKYCGSRQHDHAEHQHYHHGKLQLIVNAADQCARAA
jgi:hypothetical protein